MTLFFPGAVCFPFTLDFFTDCDFLDFSQFSSKIFFKLFSKIYCTLFGEISCGTKKLELTTALRAFYVFRSIDKKSFRFSVTGRKRLALLGLSSFLIRGLFLAGDSYHQCDWWVVFSLRSSCYGGCNTNDFILI